MSTNASNRHENSSELANVPAIFEKQSQNFVESVKGINNREAIVLIVHWVYKTIVVFAVIHALEGRVQN